jgi:MYXO-CTERM domain-containing protein
VDYVGNRKFVKSWTWWYLLRPFIGVALALLVYFAIRGGLISGSTGADSLSPYGIAALAGLAGLFSRQATDKLREVFETMFKADHPPQRSDKLTG